MSDYPSRLAGTKDHYPFRSWESSGLDQYTPEVCGSFAPIFDDLLHTLTTLGESAPESEKLAAFKDAVDALNNLSETDPGLIETGEREALCELCNVIAIAAGLDPQRYGGGEGPASEWREW